MQDRQCSPTQRQLLPLAQDTASQAGRGIPFLGALAATVMLY